MSLDATLEVLRAASAPTPARLGIAFFDLTGFYRAQLARDDQAIFAMISELADRTTAAVEASGGMVVKFIGDAALLAWPDDRMDEAAGCLLALKEETDAWLAREGYDCRLIAKLHVGPLVAGPLGGRFDVLGRTVSQAAVLKSFGVALTVEAFRSLSAGARKAFKKHTPPVRYIPVGEPHRD